MTILYGIKNCDTVKKARKWLDSNNIDYQFHDFREQGVNKKQVTNWVKALGWETVVNKRSTTWKQLGADQRESMDEASAINAIMENPTLVKRPLLQRHNDFYVGFKAADYDTLF